MEYLAGLPEEEEGDGEEGEVEMSPSDSALATVGGESLTTSDMEHPPGQRVYRVSSIIEEELRVNYDTEVVIPTANSDQFEKDAFARERTGTTDSMGVVPSPIEHTQTDPNLINTVHTIRRRTESQKRRNEFKMLTSSQLSDLFRRLDNDNNGELDLAEFLAMAKKLNLPKYLGLKEEHEAEEYMKSIFREVDVGETGTFDIEDFISAYLMIYNRTSQTEARRRQTRRPTKKPAQAIVTEVITAIRYGKKETGEFLFEVYNGHVSGPFSVFEIYEKRIYCMNESTRNLDRCPIDDFVIEAGFSPFSLETLNQMIVVDAKMNQDSHSQLFWWVDIAMDSVSPLNVNKYVAGLGLPNESKFLGNFNTFGITQSPGEKSQMFVGNGVSSLGSASSVSFFVQSLWIKNVPLVRALPEWLDSLGLYLLGASRHASLKRYYETRFAFFFPVTWPANKLAQYRRTNDDALAFASRLCCEDDELFPESSVNTSYAVWKAGGSKKWDKFKFTNVNDPSRRGNDGYRTYDEPRWLLGKSYMDDRPARVVFNNISLSLLDQSYGTSACVTIRKIDNEGKVSLDLPVQAQLGVMGRIITAVRIKLLESMIGGGLTHTCVVHEHPAEIAGHIISLVHNFSMNTLGTLSSWMTLLSREVNELTVSKHFAHSESMRECFDVIYEYVNRKHGLFSRLHKELVTAEALSAARAADKPHSVDSPNQSATSLNEMVSPEREGRKRTSTLYKNTARYQQTCTPVASTVVSVATLRPEVVVVQSLPAEVIEEFFGADFRKRISFLGHILDGDTHLEIKGGSYFRDRLERFEIQLDKLDERMKIKDDQKRNFFSFLLTVSTVFLAPLAALTGYWGMNFDNMKELDHHEYPLFPGIQLMWIAAGLIYAVLLFLSVHFRILYSAM